MSQTPPQTTPQPEKLNLSTKLAYGAGDFGTAVTANILGIFQLIFFTNIAGIPAGIAGSVLMVGKIWDAVNDPIVGILSDRTQSRWGRRYPWVIIGAIPFGISFFFMWVVPRFSTNPNTNLIALVAFYVVMGILFNTFYTVVNLPYIALTPELTQDYDERTQLNSFRFSFSIGGSILSLILAFGIFRVVQNGVQQYFWLGLSGALISVLPFYWFVWGTWKRYFAMQRSRQPSPADTEIEPNIPFGQQLKIVFSNRPFLFIIGIYLFSWLALQNTVSVIPFYIVNWMGLPSDRFTLVILAIQFTALAMLFVWSAICKKVGKTTVYIAGMALWVLVELCLFFLRPGQVTLLYILAVIAGFGVSTAYLIPWSMVPDVIDLDELQTGQRREGVFYGFMVLLQKFGLALGLFLVGNVLDWAGFIEATGDTVPQQPDSALLAIRLLTGPVPAVLLLCSIVLAYFYPISREVHAEILLKLHERRVGNTSQPPAEP